MTREIMLNIYEEIVKVRQLLEITVKEKLVSELEKSLTTTERKMIWALSDGFTDTKTISEKVGVSQRTVQITIKDLQDRDLIIVRKRGYPKRKFDYVLSSGALSFKMDNHEEYIGKMLGKMMEISLKGVAVNFLSSYVDYQLEKNFHFSPEKAFSLAKNLTKYVSIRHDYPLYEFTLYLYRKPTK